MNKKKCIVSSRAPAVGLRRLVLRWVNDPPRRLGHYWYRHSDQHDPEIVEICMEDFGPNRDMFVRFGQGPEDFNFIQNYDGQWAGPIPQPENDKLSGCRAETSSARGEGLADSCTARGLPAAGVPHLLDGGDDDQIHAEICLMKKLKS